MTFFERFVDLLWFENTFSLPSPHPSKMHSGRIELHTGNPLHCTNPHPQIRPNVTFWGCTCGIIASPDCFCDYCPTCCSYSQATILWPWEVGEKVTKSFAKTPSSVSRAHSRTFQQGWTPHPAGRGGFPAPPRPQKWSDPRGSGGAKKRSHSQIFPKEESNDGTILQHWIMPNPALKRICKRHNPFFGCDVPF